MLPVLVAMSGVLHQSFHDIMPVLLLMLLLLPNEASVRAVNEQSRTIVELGKIHRDSSARSPCNKSGLTESGVSEPTNKDTREPTSGDEQG